MRGEPRPERLKKWKPLSDIPEAPIGGFSFSGGPGAVTIRVGYPGSAAHRPRELVIIFRSAAAMMVFEEFRDPWIIFPDPTAPCCESDEWRRYLFPFVEVRDSRWLRSFPDENLVGHRKDYRHFRIGAIDGTIHVLTQVEPSPGWTIGWEELDLPVE